MLQKENLKKFEKIQVTFIWTISSTFSSTLRYCKSIHMPNPTHEKKIMNLFIRKAAANIEISNKETWTLFIQDTYTLLLWS